MKTPMMFFMVKALLMSTGAVAGSCPENNAVLRALETQSEAAVANAFRGLACLDGGDLEDVYRALGVQFEDSPQDVLAAMKNTGTPAANAAAMLVMLPLAYVDDPCAGMKKLQERRRIVAERVPDDATRVSFLDALDGAIARKGRNCPAEDSGVRRTTAARCSARDSP